MGMKIDILEYVNDAEIREAIIDGLKQYSKDNAERVISNCGYHLATGIVNEHLGEDAPEKIASQFHAVLKDLSPSTIFDAGGYGRPQSAARTTLDHVVNANKDAIDKAVKTAIHNLTKREIVEIIKSGKVKMVIGGLQS